MKAQWRLSRISLEGTTVVPHSPLRKQFPARSDWPFRTCHRPLRLHGVLAGAWGVGCHRLDGDRLIAKARGAFKAAVRHMKKCERIEALDDLVEDRSERSLTSSGFPWSRQRRAILMAAREGHDFKFRHVGLAEGDEPRAFEARDQRRIKGRRHCWHETGPAAGRPPFFVT